ncbi:MAG TPA: class I SAM-dependent methyltransferase [Gammaproteobacteria bacterium]
MATSTQWQLSRAAAESYEAVLVPAILGPAAHALVDRANPRNAEAVLDAGCGTGAATREAAHRVGPQGRVTGVDVNPGMIAVAGSLPVPAGSAPIDWRVGSAAALPVDDAGVDLVICAQALQFMDDPAMVAREMRRVLEPGGRVAVSTWSALSRNPYFDALVDALAAHISTDAANGLKSAFSLSEEDRLCAPFSGAGFRDIGVFEIAFDVRLPPMIKFIPEHAGATPLADAFAAIPETVRMTIVTDVARRLDAAVDDEVETTFRTHVLIAYR